MNRLELKPIFVIDTLPDGSRLPTDEITVAGWTPEYNPDAETLDDALLRFLCYRPAVAQ